LSEKFFLALEEKEREKKAREKRQFAASRTGNCKMGTILMPRLKTMCVKDTAL
jgi:hypothetical protein